MSAGSLEIRHDEARRRFVAEPGGGEAVLEYAWTPAGALDMRHTFVPPAHRGRGIASLLAETALTYAQANGSRVIPSCPFIARYIDAHPEYRPLLAH